MQRIYITVLVILVSITTACKKNSNNNPDNIPGLPPATQSGANTFGCLVNGVAWVPEGYGGGSPNLSIDYDPGIDNGYFSIYAKKILPPPNISSSIRLGILDSMNFRSTPIKIMISNNSKGYINYSIIGRCFLNPFETTTTAFGEIIIAKHDKQLRIISGTFQANLSKVGCDTIKITNGRFDFKF